VTDSASIDPTGVLNGIGPGGDEHACRSLPAPENDRHVRAAYRLAQAATVRQEPPRLPLSGCGQWSSCVLDRIGHGSQHGRSEAIQPVGQLAPFAWIASDLKSERQGTIPAS
jgi:hypothetical protein